MPPAAQNENQGLKIAVACFVMLSVILAVTTYFGFKSYSESEKRLATAESDLKNEKDEHAKKQRILNDAKDKIGLSKTDDAELVKAIAKYREDIKRKVEGSVEEGKRAIAQYKDSGGASPKVDELSQSLETILSGLNDPAQSLTGLADRLQELLHNQSMIATNLGLEFKNTRSILEAMNEVNKSKLQIELDAVSATKKDLNDEHDKHEQARQALMAKVDALQTDSNRLAQELATVKNALAQKEDDWNKQRNDLLAIVRSQRDQMERKETILDKKDGTVTFVDYGRGEVRVDLTRGTGAREQMVLTIFDRSAPGLPTDKPKGTIELIQVGATGSIARIIDTKSSVNPIRAGDQVYSSAWDPNRPQLFALIGKIDINRDGRDDRADLKRMIEASGGRVAYDLPPAGVGVESGKLTPQISWYVTDERIPYHPSNAREAKALGTEDEGFLKKKTAAIATARLDGIRPKPVERLLNELGYSYGTAVPGRVEAADRKGIDSILHPGGRVGTLPAGDTTEKKEGEEKKDDDAAKKDEEKKDDDTKKDQN